MWLDKYGTKLLNIQITESDLRVRQQLDYFYIIPHTSGLYMYIIYVSSKWVE